MFKLENDEKSSFQEANDFYSYAKALAILRENYMRYRPVASSRIPTQIDEAISALVKEVQDGGINPVEDENPLPYDGTKSLQEEGKGFDALTDIQKEELNGALEERIETEELIVTVDGAIMLFTIPSITSQMGYKETKTEFPYDKILDWFFYKGL